MIVKEGVELSGVRPDLLRLLAIADEAHQAVFGEEAVLTSAIRKPTTKVSLHPYGLAADLRDIYYHASPDKPLSDAQKKLQQVFVGVVLARARAAGIFGVEMIHHGPTPHFHMEIDPKP